jgi:hypothetical protein
MRKTAIIILTIVLCLMTIVFVTTFFYRLTINYNDEGNYFEESSGIVYHQQAVLAYGIIATIFLFLSFLTIRKLFQRLYKK